MGGVSFPNPIALPRPILNEPAANIPSYKPMVVAPRVLAPPQGVPTLRQEEILEEAEKRKEEEKLVTAGTTASVSVIATLTVTSLFKQTVKVMKPIIKQIATRIQKKFNGKGRAT